MGRSNKSWGELLHYLQYWQMFSDITVLIFVVLVHVNVFVVDFSENWFVLLCILQLSHCLLLNLLDRIFVDDQRSW